VHDADRLQLSNVHVEALRLLHTVCVSRHAVTLDANTLESMALSCAMLTMQPPKKSDGVAKSFVCRQGPVGLSPKSRKKGKNRNYARE
jgi:hypothetical protein